MSQTIIVAVTVAMLESCHPVMRLRRCRPVVHDGTTHAVIKTNVNAAVSLCKGTARCAPQPQASELRARLVQSSPTATPEAVSLMHSPVMQIRADNIVGEADTAGAVRFSESRVGRARLERVTVRNRGLADTVAAAPAAGAMPCHWKRNVPRLEACSITLRGRSEFDARDVVIAGDAAFTVPDGYRMEVCSLHHRSSIAGPVQPGGHASRCESYALHSHKPPRTLDVVPICGTNQPVCNLCATTRILFAWSYIVVATHRTSPFRVRDQYPVFAQRREQVNDIVRRGRLHS